MALGLLVSLLQCVFCLQVLQFLRLLPLPLLVVLSLPLVVVLGLEVLVNPKRVLVVLDLGFLVRFPGLPWLSRLRLVSLCLALLLHSYPLEHLVHPRLFSFQVPRMLCLEPPNLPRTCGLRCLGQVHAVKRDGDVYGSSLHRGGSGGGLFRRQPLRPGLSTLADASLLGPCSTPPCRQGGSHGQPYR